ncbi:hypothetical protein B0H17DRAFT_1130627 [Mycena rosella]|uniref:Zn(2)-C6 fungal-type domain-containing protein n=1 Tax=Mycena rosella TaxID=1033263 RepID=A0AAD7GN76_MYCRO|nr:hypothetical protein B0H17DRAFT_1130627 [Mycena rosella]
MKNTPSAHKPLERGSACIFCRKRKVKCDGARPACARCSNLGRGAGCEHSGTYNQTDHQHLEASIARLEARILQLGGTLPTAPEVIIHEPHLDGHPPGWSFSAWKRDRPQQPSQLQVTLPDGWWKAPIPPQNVTKLLMECFARHASQFGFFLNGPRIVRSVLSPDSRHPISPGLLNIILLFGIELSGSPVLKAHESTFLGRALQFSTSPQLHQVIQNIQTEELLAQYFLRQGRFVEAMHHINSAVSLCIGCGLHKMPGTDPDGSAYALSPARDAVEHGERVNAVWSVLGAHGIFSIMMQWPSDVTELLGEQMNLPWPLEMEVYQSGIVPINPQAQFTVKAFLNDPVAANFEAANSYLGQHAKAAALFERASHIGGNRTNLANPDEYTQFIKFEHGLKQVIHTLPSFDTIPESIDTIRQRLVTFTLCQVAIIQLHCAIDTTASIHKCLNAAQAVVAANQRIPNMHVWEYIDSTMGTLWVAICQVIIRAIATIKNPRGATRGWAASVSSRDFPVLKAAFANITSVMELFSARCRLIGK